MEVIERKVRRLTADWKCLPPVHVVPTYEQLPVRAPEDCEGLYYRRSVFMVGGLDEDRAVEVLGHELTHHSTRVAMAPSAWNTFMGSLLDGQRAGDRVLTNLRVHVRMLYDENELHPLREADEMLSRLAEVRINPRTARFEVRRPALARLRAAAAHFARERLYLPIPATAQELDGHLLHMEQRLRRGTTLWDRLGLMYAGVMEAKPTGPKEPARSVAESEAMLRRETAREQSHLPWKTRLGLWGLYAAFAVFIASWFVPLVMTTAERFTILSVPVLLVILWWVFFRQD